MVILKLMGGLGNQMFQFAAGLALARRLKTELCLDCSDFETHHKRQFTLDNYCIDGLYRPLRIDTLDATKFTRNRLLWRLGLARRADRYFHFREKQFHFDEFFARLTGNVILVGHWNSVRYFASAEAEVRAAFRLRPELEAAIDPVLRQEIETCNSVSLHVRRGDYVTEAKAASVHGFIGLDYYRKAVEELCRRVDDPVFYLFTDDKAWVREHFSFLERFRIVDEAETQRDIEDLFLLSRCRHHIIANSTFSWWGAYLSDYAGKQVYMPQQWFADPKKDTRDIFVPGWHVIA